MVINFSGGLFMDGLQTEIGQSFSQAALDVEFCAASRRVSGSRQSRRRIHRQELEQISSRIRQGPHHQAGAACVLNTRAQRVGVRARRLTDPNLIEGAGSAAAKD
jgi:hypothetical protein